MVRVLDVALRLLAAVFGGYGLTVVLGIFLARTLPMAPSQAVTTALLLSFLIYLLTVIGVFAARSALRAWGWILLLAALFAALTPLLDRSGLS